MKNKIIASVLLAASISFSGNMSAQELFRADFETYETTPYFFRFGNKGKLGDYKPKSRWMYSHEVIDNPVASALFLHGSTRLRTKVPVRQSH